MTERFGYTTGTYAAAAAKGALTVLVGKGTPKEVELMLPGCENVRIPLSSIEEKDGSVICGVIKRSVEEADVTHNMDIYAEVSQRDDGLIRIDGGNGIGRITKRGLQLPVGEAAINPVPRRMISYAVRELTSGGVNVLISAPKGEEIAAATTNSRLGIIGGISIIGTTGIMRPKSLASFKRTILQQIKFNGENGAKELIITPGNISERAMMDLFGGRISEERIIQSGDHLGFTLKSAAKTGVDIVLAGHPGKLAKVLSGHFQTHYSKSPPANTAVIGFMRDSLDTAILGELNDSTTVEGMTGILREHGLGELLNGLAEAIEERVKGYLKTERPIPTLLFNMDRELIASSETGYRWAEG